MVDSTPVGCPSVELGPDMAIVYDGPRVRFSHVCDRGDRGIIRCAPALQIGAGHTIVTRFPLTIVASISCPDCGTHGWVTDGRWVPC